MIENRHALTQSFDPNTYMHKVSVKSEDEVIKEEIPTVPSQKLKTIDWASAGKIDPMENIHRAIMPNPGSTFRMGVTVTNAPLVSKQPKLKMFD